MVGRGAEFFGGERRWHCGELGEWGGLDVELGVGVVKDAQSEGCGLEELTPQPHKPYMAAPRAAEAASIDSPEVGRSRDSSTGTFLQGYL